MLLGVVVVGLDAGGFTERRKFSARDGTGEKEIERDGGGHQAYIPITTFQTHIPTEPARFSSSAPQKPKGKTRVHPEGIQSR